MIRVATTTPTIEATRAPTRQSSCASARAGIVADPPSGTLTLSHGDNRDGRRWPVTLGEPATPFGATMPVPVCFGLSKLPLEQVKATTDITLQELFASYANSLREALHKVFDRGLPQTSTHHSQPTRHEANGYAKRRTTSGQRQRPLCNSV